MVLDPQNDVKSGRSYGVGPAGTESDPSDVAYLRELESYFHLGAWIRGTFPPSTDESASPTAMLPAGPLFRGLDKRWQPTSWPFTRPNRIATSWWA